MLGQPGGGGAVQQHFARFINEKLTVPTRLMAHVKQWFAMAAFRASIAHMGSLWGKREETPSVGRGL